MAFGVIPTKGNAPPGSTDAPTTEPSSSAPPQVPVVPPESSSGLSAIVIVEIVLGSLLLAAGLYVAVYQIKGFRNYIEWLASNVLFLTIPIFVIIGMLLDIFTDLVALSLTFYVLAIVILIFYFLSIFANSSAAELSKMTDRLIEAGKETSGDLSAEGKLQLELTKMQAEDAWQNGTGTAESVGNATDRMKSWLTGTKDKKKRFEETFNGVDNRIVYDLWMNSPRLKGTVDNHDRTLLYLKTAITDKIENKADQLRMWGEVKRSANKWRGILETKYEVEPHFLPPEIAAHEPITHHI
jgi:hypothetical protein